MAVTVELQTARGVTTPSRPEPFAAVATAAVALDQLADAVGLTSVHLNRTLKALRNEGVTFSGKRVRIADWSALTHLAEFDPVYLLVPKPDSPGGNARSA